MIRIKDFTRIRIDTLLELFRLSVEIMFSRDYSAKIRYGSASVADRHLRHEHLTKHR